MHFPADMKQLDAMLRYVSTQAIEAGIDPDVRSKLELACEEVFANIIHHAYEGAGGDIEVTCRGRFEVEIRDWGKPFDSTQPTEIDVEEGLDRRKMGGLGVFFLQRLVKDVSYAREDGANVLRIFS